MVGWKGRPSQMVRGREQMAPRLTRSKYETPWNQLNSVGASSHPFENVEKSVLSIPHVDDREHLKSSGINVVLLYSRLGNYKCCRAC